MIVTSSIQSMLLLCHLQIRYAYQMAVDGWFSECALAS